MRGHNPLASLRNPAILWQIILFMNSGTLPATIWAALALAVFAFFGDAHGAPDARESSTNASDSRPANRGFRSRRSRDFIDPPVLNWAHLPDAEDADALMAAFNRAFYVQTSSGNGYFRSSTASDKHADFWKLAEEIEMVIDVCERSHNPSSIKQVIQLINGFDAIYGAAWTNNVFNDDVMWICIANLRGYQLTGNTQWRDHARENFDAVYARAWDTNFMGGGLFWKTENLSKNTCVNAPAAIAACLLWKSFGETEYRDKANAIVDWVKAVLSDGNGWIYDSIKTNGAISRGSLTYNQGTYIGACNFLGRMNDASQAANFVMRNQGASVNGFCILPPYRAMGDLAGFHGIFFRWMARYVKDQHLESIYLPWLQANALSAWSVRRASDSLSWSNWMQKTPSDASFDLPSWACSSSVVALQVLSY
jgi:predicted alpha-1,6-mannanase (GH76 family)